MMNQAPRKTLQLRKETKTCDGSIQICKTKTLDGPNLNASSEMLFAPSTSVDECETYHQDADFGGWRKLEHATRDILDNCKYHDAAAKRCAGTQYTLENIFTSFLIVRAPDA